MIAIVFLIMVAGQLGEAQKSFYASQQSWYPKVLAKYTTTTAPTTASEDLVNRVGDGSFNPEASTTESEPDYNPDNNELINRVPSWPQNRQPFWYRNRQAIQSMINQRVDGGTLQQKLPPKFTSPFASRRF